MFIAMGIVLIVLGFIFIKKAVGLAVLMLLIGIVFDVVGIVKNRSRKVEQPAPTPASPKQDTYIIPEYIGDAGRKYFYSDIPMTMTNEAAIKDAALAGRWELTASVKDKRIYFYSDGVELGYIERMYIMMDDWQKRGEPYLSIIQNYNDEKGTLIAIAYYETGYRPDDDIDDDDDDDIK